MRREPPPQSRPRYRGYRIHTAQLPSGRWLSSLVALGKQPGVTRDALTPVVTRVPGEYASEPEALQAARRYIDEATERRPDSG